MLKDLDRKIEPYKIPHSGLQAPYYTPSRATQDITLNEHILFERRRFYELWLRQRRQSSETIRSKFRRLATLWKREAAFLPSSRKMATLDSYQQIIGMGEAVLPFILNELRKEPDYWFWALRAISGVDPVPPKVRGDLKAMSKAWINWGIENRIVK